MEVAKRMNYSRLIFYTRFCKQLMSTKPKIITEIDHEVNKNIEDCKFKPRKHPGRLKVATSQLPEKIVKTIQSIVKDLPTKSLLSDGEAFGRYLFSRHPPQEECDIAEKKEEIHKEVTSKYNVDAQSLTQDQMEHFKQVIGGQVKSLLQKRTYNWKRLDFNEYLCHVYMFGRAAQNYAVICRIFNEISVRCPDYKPKSLFDFGSGIGTVSWAADNFWKKSLKEYYCIDSSSAMHNLASLILREGDERRPAPQNIFYRQFLPSQNTPYSLVVSAYSLFELPSSNSRLETLLNLWEKTEDYLVIIEQGTMAGYKLVLEARDFILSLKDKGGNLTGHVFAPCPHDLECPRLSSTYFPCTFKVSLFALQLGQREKIKSELFSYVVLKKGLRNVEDPQWPRIVMPVLKKSKHSICRLCTSSGKFQEVIFSAAKHGKIPFRCARSSDWGDLLPISVKSEAENENPPKK